MITMMIVMVVMMSIMIAMTNMLILTTIQMMIIPSIVIITNMIQKLPARKIIHRDL